MPISRTNHAALATGFAVALAFMLPFPASGQTELNPPSSEALEDGEFQIDFPGGTVKDYVQMIRLNAPRDYYHHLNIVLTEIPSEFRLPEIKVFTDLDGMLGCLSACSNDAWQVEVDSDDTGTVTIIRVVDIGSERRSPDQTTVINVKNILLRIPEQDFVAAITLGLDFADVADGVQIKLHNETGLLFARGKPQGLALVHEIIQQMGETIPADPDNSIGDGLSR
jgi:hypothetical protein